MPEVRILLAQQTQVKEKLGVQRIHAFRRTATHSLLRIRIRRKAVAPNGGVTQMTQAPNLSGNRKSREDLSRKSLLPRLEGAVGDVVSFE